jgi:phosphatidylserine/phosphatidylglycerophosphate/cardiolipin synthase-like enzyme
MCTDPAMSTDPGLGLTRGLARNCVLEPYEAVPVEACRIDGEVIAYASPDSTWIVTRRLIEGATRSILIGTYDFTASYMADLLKAAVARGVRVGLMLNLDGLSGELKLYQSLGASGVTVHAAARIRTSFPRVTRR